MSGISIKSEDDVGKGPNDVCVICLERHIINGTQALFTSECGHVFHFLCIASNVRYGQNVSCPLCRVEWRQVPWTKPDSQHHKGSGRNDESRASSSYSLMDTSSHANTKSIDFLSNVEGGSQNSQLEEDLLSFPELIESSKPLKVATKLSFSICAEAAPPPFQEVERSFNVLISLKSVGMSGQSSARSGIDLVTVLDLSGSMNGQKLELLKEAMAFVVSILSDNDRLSIVRFSNSASVALGLTVMNENGKEKANRAISQLSPYGSTNIIDGVKTAQRILSERRTENFVSAIILSSDGQDNSALQQEVKLRKQQNGAINYKAFLTPLLEEALPSRGHGNRSFPIHSFGFGEDHDPSLLHGLSELSGGTFSFIQSDNNVKEAFAQCVGGLLSVTAQEVTVSLTARSAAVKIGQVHSGPIPQTIEEDLSSARVAMGDVYADEEKNILAEIWIQPDEEKDLSLRSKEPLLEVECSYFELHGYSRTERTLRQAFSLSGNGKTRPGKSNSTNLQRHQNRLKTATAISAASDLADKGEYQEAKLVLNSCQASFRNSGLFSDDFSKALGLELNDIEQKMADEQVYKSSGRALTLSSHLSHVSQRASMRGNNPFFSTEYQTPSMVSLRKKSRSRADQSQSSESGIGFRVNKITKDMLAVFSKLSG